MKHKRKFEVYFKNNTLIEIVADELKYQRTMRIVTFVNDGIEHRYFYDDIAKIREVPYGLDS